MSKYLIAGTLMTALRALVLPAMHASAFTASVACHSGDFSFCYLFGLNYCRISRNVEPVWSFKNAGIGDSFGGVPTTPANDMDFFHQVVYGGS